jgi:hypothetical protein
MNSFVALKAQLTLTRPHSNKKELCNDIPRQPKLNPENLEQLIIIMFPVPSEAICAISDRLKTLPHRRPTRIGEPRPEQCKLSRAQRQFAKDVGSLILQQGSGPMLWVGLGHCLLHQSVSFWECRLGCRLPHCSTVDRTGSMKAGAYCQHMQSFTLGRMACLGIELHLLGFGGSPCRSAMSVDACSKLCCLMRGLNNVRRAVVVSIAAIHLLYVLASACYPSCF